MNKEQLPIPQMNDESWAEAFLQTIHNAIAISSIPIISPAICSLLSSRLQTLGKKRFNEFFEDIIEYVKQSDKKILQSQDFIIATEITIKKIVNQHNKNKRKRLSNLYKNYLQEYNCCKLAPSIDHFEIFLSIANTLPDNSLLLLVILKEVGLITPFSAITECGDKFKEFNELSDKKYNGHYYHRSMAELESGGLITQASGLWGGNVPYVTQLGLDFAQWLEKDKG